MSNETKMSGRIGIFGVLEFLDKDGKVLKTTEMRGSIPLTQEQATEVAKDMEKQDGAYYSG